MRHYVCGNQVFVNHGLGYVPRPLGVDARNATANVGRPVMQELAEGAQVRAAAQTGLQRAAGAPVPPPPLQRAPVPPPAIQQRAPIPPPPQRAESRTPAVAVSDSKECEMLKEQSPDACWYLGGKVTSLDVAGTAKSICLKDGCQLPDDVQKRLQEKCGSAPHTFAFEGGLTQCFPRYQGGAVLMPLESGGFASIR